MSVDMTEWLKALQHWQNSGRTVPRWVYALKYGPDAGLGICVVLMLAGVVVLGFLFHFERNDPSGESTVIPHRFLQAVAVVLDGVSLLAFICLAVSGMDVHTWENPPTGFQTQVEKAYNVQIIGSDTSVGGSTVRLVKNPVKLDSDTLHAGVKDMRKANMPANGAYGLDYTDKDGILHHGTLAIKDTTITLYDETGKPVNPVKGLK